MKDGIKIRGFSRVRITEKGKVVGDSGLIGPNVFCNDGFYNMLTGIRGVAGYEITVVAIGTGTIPNASHVTLNGEIMGSTKRLGINATVINSKTYRMLFTFASSASFLTAAANIQNIGLFMVTATATGVQLNKLICGNTYSSSSCNTNQDINGTYEIQFS